MKVLVHLNEQSQPISHDEVVNTYTKGGLYCVLVNYGRCGEKAVFKYPLVNIFRVYETDGLDIPDE